MSLKREQIIFKNYIRMENTQRVWNLCYYSVFKYLAAKSHWIIKATRLSQTIYFQNVLSSKWKSKDVTFRNRLCFYFHMK